MDTLGKSRCKVRDRFHITSKAFCAFVVSTGVPEDRAEGVVRRIYGVQENMSTSHVTMCNELSTQPSNDGQRAPHETRHDQTLLIWLYHYPMILVWRSA